jgi:hypothetical protein
MKTGNRLRAIVASCFALALIATAPEVARAQWSSSGGNTTTNDKVGIGTTGAPSQKLDVVGNILLDSSGNWYGINKASGEARAVMFNGAVLSDSDYLYFGSLNNGFKFVDASNNPLMTILNGGNLGIGTTSPPRRFTVSNGGAEGLEIGPGNVNGDAGGEVSYINYNRSTGAWIPARWYASQFRVSGVLSNEFSMQLTNGGSTGHNFGLNVDAGSNSSDQSFRVRPSGGGADYLAVRGDGNVGIGTASPSEKLEVIGNLKLTGSGNINATGTVEAGNIKAKYQDVAEWVPASEQLPAGTVVVLDSTKANQVTSSSTSYDTRVAGVISEQPGIALGEKSDGKVLVATTGRVRVKVDASKSPIQIGALLVTSDVPGFAMKSEPVNLGGVQLHRPGTLIGKAQEPLAKGKGEILVLLSLQ